MVKFMHVCGHPVGDELWYTTQSMIIIEYDYLMMTGAVAGSDLVRTFDNSDATANPPCCTSLVTAVIMEWVRACLRHDLALSLD